jgi:hypothetical protein
MRWTLAVALAAALLTGCAQVHSVDLAQPEGDALAELTEESLVHKTMLEFDGGVSHVAADLRLVEGFLEWRDVERNGEAMRSPVAELTSITLVNRGRGAWQGEGFGFVLGFVGGLVFAEAVDTWDNAETRLAWGAIGAATGSAAGAVFGAVRGSPDIHTVDPGSP